MSFIMFTVSHISSDLFLSCSIVSSVLRHQYFQRLSALPLPCLSWAGSFLRSPAMLAILSVKAFAFSSSFLTFSSTFFYYLANSRTGGMDSFDQLSQPPIIFLKFSIIFPVSSCLDFFGYNEIVRSFFAMRF